MPIWASFARELEILDLGRAEFVKSATLPVKSNWKYALDTYGEGYHAIALHRESLGPLFRCDISIFDTSDRTSASTSSSTP